ncbi:hypothetical protein GFJ94_11405 [Flavobacterium sp. LMO8]|uniref:hypothetical protein n=1 Tax=Flavobacterium sp. LMO8 TaxID=2654244 RepID=UPI001290DFCF|nr:hypothetical protein [Flavobacterium sp. LMO8]MQP25669.1 hypothetical protein [Flavobacterium sp. LMO8]
MIIEDSKKLVDSMSMNEKRYFKIFINKNIFGSQNKYLLLFDILNSNETITEDNLKKHVKKQGYSDKNISYDINYLNKIILRSLNEFHHEKTISLKLQNHIKSVEILFYKGLYDECLKIIRKAKKLSLKNENEILILELLNWEKKCMGYSKGFYEAMSVNEKIDNYFNYIKENREITDLYYHSYFLKNNVGKIPYDGIIEEFNKIIGNAIFKKDGLSLHSVQSKIFYFLTIANFFHVINQKDSELDNLEKTIEVFDNNPFYKEENPLDYISVYTRVIDIYKKSDDISFYNKIEALRGFENILDFQKSVAQERIFFHTNQAQLEFLIYNNYFEEALKIMHLVLKSLKENKFKIEPYYFIGMYHQFACIFLIKKNFSQSLKYINLILNEFKQEDRPKSFIKTEILNLIIHYELKNYKLVLHNYTNYNKKYKRVFKLNFIEKNIIQLIVQISENPFGTIENIEFKKLHTKIQKKNDLEDSISNKIYRKYIESKIIYN